MNKAFRTIWNDVRQSFVTTSEIQTSHGKSTKSSVSLCVAAALFVMGGVASAAYVETGVVGDKSSWETPEYQADWGLEAMKSSSAYSLGFFGHGFRGTSCPSGFVWRTYHGNCCVRNIRIEWKSLSASCVNHDLPRRNAHFF